MNQAWRDKTDKTELEVWGPAPLESSPIWPTLTFFDIMPLETLSLTKKSHDRLQGEKYPHWMHIKNGYCTKIIFRWNPNEVPPQDAEASFSMHLFDFDWH